MIYIFIYSDSCKLVYERLENIVWEILLIVLGMAACRTWNDRKYKNSAIRGRKS